jgi:hypothetical protein
MHRRQARTVPCVAAADTVSAWVGVASEAVAAEVAAVSEVAAEVVGGAGDDWCRRRTDFVVKYL